MRVCVFFTCSAVVVYMGNHVCEAHLPDILQMSRSETISNPYCSTCVENYCLSLSISHG